MKLARHNIANYLPLSRNHAVVSINMPPKLVNWLVSEIESKDVQVVAIQRGETLNLAPKDEDFISNGDVLILMGITTKIVGLANRFSN